MNGQKSVCLVTKCRYSCVKSNGSLVIRRGGTLKPRISLAKPYLALVRPARHPVTNAQFACFVTAPDFSDGRWWRGVPDKVRQIDDAFFPPYANSPREMVS